MLSVSGARLGALKGMSFASKLSEDAASALILLEAAEVVSPDQKSSLLFVAWLFVHHTEFNAPTGAERNCPGIPFSKKRASGNCFPSHSPTIGSSRGKLLLLIRPLSSVGLQKNVDLAKQHESCKQSLGPRQRLLSAF